MFGDRSVFLVTYNRSFISYNLQDETSGDNPSISITVLILPSQGLHYIYAGDHLHQELFVIGSKAGAMADVKELRALRLDRDSMADPEGVLRLARPLIKSGTILKTGDDAWDIYEQTLIAALEVSEDSLAIECMTRLGDKFPGSGRVHALRGMVLESTQPPSEALNFYEEVLRVEPTNIV